MDRYSMLMDYSEGIESFDPPDFKTHLNYLSCIESLADSLSIKVSQNLQKSIPESKNLQKKITLINLTKNAIDGELATINSNNEYAELCV